MVAAGTLIVGGLAAAAVLSTVARRNGRSTTPFVPGPRPPVPPEGVEFGGIPFPPPKAGKQWERLQYLATIAEQTTGMRGLYSYLLATARTESGGAPSAMNTVTDAGPAFNLFCGQNNYNGRYRNNPWRPPSCERDAPHADRWAYSGGWFQIMPAVALATADKRGHRHDPARVFDPPFAVAYATDLVRRIKRGYGAQTWGDIRAGWALPRWAKPSSTSEKKQKVIDRLNRSASKMASFGVDPSIGARTFNTKNYPGFTHLLHALLAAEGRVPAAAA